MTPARVLSMAAAMFRLPALERKLLRDLWRMRGQALAIGMVAMCGVASFVTMQGSYEALLSTRATYYEQYRFADVFANLKRAPDSLLERVRQLPGVKQVQGRVVFDASLDVPGLDEPASGRLVTLPRHAGEGLNGVHLRAGRLPGAAQEAAVSEAFAQANNLQAGDSLLAVINGRKERLRIVGIAISPEYISEMKGNAFPDNRRFGVLWMEHEALAGALDMRDGFNDLTLTLSPRASENRVIEQVDALLAPYGSLGAYGRVDQLSHNFLDNELAQARVSATVLPAIFMGVVAFLIHNVLLRITSLQRPQIGLLKSFGYGNFAIGMHYVKFALLTVGVGGLTGIALGAWLGEQLAQVYALFYHFPTLHFALSPRTLSMAALIAVAAAALGSALAVARVLRLPPAEAMRASSPARFRPGPLERLGLQRFIPLPARMVLRNLERNPVKAGLSVLGLALAAALMVTGQYSFDALDEIVRIQFRTAQRDDITVNFNEIRSVAALHALASMPGVLRVEGFRTAAVRLRAGHREKKTVILGLDAAPELRRVLDENERPVALPAQGIVLSKKLAELLGQRAGNMLEVEFMEGRRQTVLVRISAVIDEPIGLLSYMDRAALSRLLGESDTVSGAYLRLDAQQQSGLYRLLKSVPAISSVTLREATLESFMETVAENMRISTRVLVLFACVIAIGVVYNSARLALSEHALELASLRILGFTKGEVGRMLLGEQALLVLVSLPLGGLIGYGLSALLSQLLSQELFRIPLVVSTQTFISAAATVLLSSMASGLLVWRRVRQLDLIEVLKTRE
ncbi:ABC transporter permease [Lacisediminimonas sp.]|uniref:ABC transporter permease n=1 Tax=Lacisediminimonas sp. TaxID=3060582 RepID=UPI002717FA4A|nr:ABC transporter permease [Lacisediminimonas sp.]MDO8300359.1 FtsX-like permease family protein [Lacisediminimonas sp.]